MQIKIYDSANSMKAALDTFMHAIELKGFAMPTNHVHHITPIFAQDNLAFGTNVMEVKPSMMTSLVHTLFT